MVIFKAKTGLLDYSGQLIYIYIYIYINNKVTMWDIQLQIFQIFVVSHKMTCQSLALRLIP